MMFQYLGDHQKETIKSLNKSLLYFFTVDNFISANSSEKNWLWFSCQIFICYLCKAKICGLVFFLWSKSKAFIHCNRQYASGDIDFTHCHTHKNLTTLSSANSPVRMDKYQEPSSNLKSQTVQMQFKKYEKSFTPFLQQWAQLSGWATIRPRKDCCGRPCTGILHTALYSWKK